VIDRPRNPTPRVLRRRRVSPPSALLSVHDRHIPGIDPQDVKSLLIDVMNFGNPAVRGSSRDTGVAHREQGDTPSLRPANFGASCGGTCRHRSLHEGDRRDYGREAYGTPCDQHRATHCERPNFEHEHAPSLALFAIYALIQDHDLHPASVLGIRCGADERGRSSSHTISTHATAPSMLGQIRAASRRWLAASVETSLPNQPITSKQSKPRNSSAVQRVGALAHTRHGHRVGAEAVARDAAGGAEETR